MKLRAGWNEILYIIVTNGGRVPQRLLCSFFCNLHTRWKIGLEKQVSWWKTGMNLIKSLMKHKKISKSFEELTTFFKNSPLVCNIGRAQAYIEICNILDLADRWDMPKSGECQDFSLSFSSWGWFYPSYRFYRWYRLHIFIFLPQVAGEDQKSTKNSLFAVLALC